MIHVIAWFAILISIYLLTVGSLDPGDALVGAVVASLVMTTFRKFFRFKSTLSPAAFIRRAAAFIPFSLAVLREVLNGSILLTKIVLGLRPMPRGGLVLIPLESRTEIGSAVTAFTMGLSPGSIWIDTDWEHGFMLFHMVDAEDPEAVRAHASWLYHRYQKTVFP